MEPCGGRVRLLTNTAGLYEFLPAMLADYLLTYPKIDLEIAERPSQDIVQAISSGDFDAGLDLLEHSGTTG
jgi:DNA-binding transcriptional LysR family regulator